MASNRKRLMFDFFAKPIKKNADKAGGERQETSSSTGSLLIVHQIILQRTNLFKIPMKVKHRLHQIRAATAERKNLKSDLLNCLSMAQ